jgi:Na+/phosphate symporter
MHVSRKLKARTESRTESRVAQNSSTAAAASAEAVPSRLVELQRLVLSCEQDFMKTYQSGNKEAAKRVRRTMQEIRALAVTIRQEVQAHVRDAQSSKESQDRKPA